MNDTLKITILSGPLQGTKYSLQPPMLCTIGRSDDCSIIIKDDLKISRQHCQIEVAESISIKDLNSANGIKINDVLIDPMISHLLVDGDKVKLGDFVFKVEIVKTEVEPELLSIDSTEEPAVSESLQEIKDTSPILTAPEVESVSEKSSSEDKAVSIDSTEKPTVSAVLQSSKKASHVAPKIVRKKISIQKTEREKAISLKKREKPRVSNTSTLLKDSKSKLSKSKPLKKEAKVVDKKSKKKIKQPKPIKEKISIAKRLRNFRKEITTIANQRALVEPTKEPHHDSKKIEGFQKYDQEKMLHIIEGSYTPLDITKLFTKEKFNIISFALNVVFWLTEKVHIGISIFFKYARALLIHLFNKISWPMRFAFMLTLLGTLAIAIGEFGMGNYIAMSGFDAKQAKLLESTGILYSVNLFSTLSIYVGCFMLVTILVLLLKNKFSLLFLKISSAAFCVITFWTLLFLVRIPSLMLKIDQTGKLFDKYYRNHLWISWIWLWVGMALLAFVFLTVVTLHKVKKYYNGTSKKRSLGDKIIEDFNNSQDPRFRSSTYWSGFLHIFLLFLPFLMIRGCMKDYDIPKGDGAPQTVVIQKIKKPKEKKEFIFNMNSAISFYVPELDDEMMKALDKETEDQYQASTLAGQASKKGGRPGWPSGMEDARVRFVRLKYQGGDWDQNMGKGADYNFLIKFAELTGFKIADNTEAIEIGDLRRFKNRKAPPFVYITGGQGTINISQKDIQTLRWYLTEQGGMLFADNGGGNFNSSIRSVIRRIFPDKELVDIANDDIIYQTPFYFPEGAPRLFHHSGDRALGINYNGRWAMFYHQGDINDVWETGGSGVSEAIRSQAFKMGINVVNYAFNTYMNIHYGEE